MRICVAVSGVSFFDESGSMLSYFSAQVTQDQTSRLNPLKKETIHL